jgi:hypothetical protein
MPDNDETVVMQARIRGALLEDVEGWRRRQKRVPHYSETLRQLLRIGVDADRRREPAPNDQNT